MSAVTALDRARRMVGRALVLAVALLAVAGIMKRRPVPLEAIDSSLLRPPVQRATSRPPFAFDFRGRQVSVRPVAEYAIGGLVMSHNDVESFADIYHDSSSVDTKDLCLLSGESLGSDDFHQVRVSSGPFTCYFRYPSGIRFRPQDLSNNHLITADDEIRGRLEQVHVGDQVRARGLLVDYQMEDWRDFWRRTSTAREDEDCEVLLVEDFEVVRAAAPRWHRLYRLGWWLIAALPPLWVALLWLSIPARPPRSGR